MVRFFNSYCTANIYLQVFLIHEEIMKKFGHIYFYNLIKGITISRLHIFNASEWGLEKWFYLYILLYIYMYITFSKNMWNID